MVKNRLIVIEGVDSVGKTTVCEKLTIELKCFSLAFPQTGTRTGRWLERYLKGEQKANRWIAFWNFCVNMWEYNRAIKELLDVRDVILDRYWMSNVAYFAPFRMNKRIMKFICKRMLLKPDYTFILDAPIEVLMERQAGNSIHDRNYNFLDLVRWEYLKLAKLEGNLWIADATKPIDEVVAQLKVWLS